MEVSERLTDVPTERNAPPEWVRAFREVDPRTELIYIGKGKWWVGIVYEDIPLIHIGRAEVEQIKANGGASWPTERLALLKAAGWRRVMLWAVDPWTKDWVQLLKPKGDDGWGKMLRQYRIQNDVYMKYPDSNAAHKRLMMRHEMGATSEKLQSAIDKILEMFRAQKGEIWRRLRGRKVFSGLGGFLKPRGG